MSDRLIFIIRPNIKNIKNIVMSIVEMCIGLSYMIVCIL
jgi:hypothetical protein